MGKGSEPCFSHNKFEQSGGAQHMITPSHTHVVCGISVPHLCINPMLDEGSLHYNYTSLMLCVYVLLPVI